MKKVIQLTPIRRVYDEETVGNCRVISSWLLPKRDASPLKSALMAVESPLPDIRAALHLDVDSTTREVRGLRLTFYHPPTIYEGKDGISGWILDPDGPAPLSVALRRWFAAEQLPLHTTDPSEIVRFFTYFLHRIPGLITSFRIEG